MPFYYNFLVFFLVLLILRNVVLGKNTCQVSKQQQNVIKYWFRWLLSGLGKGTSERLWHTLSQRLKLWRWHWRWRCWHCSGDAKQLWRFSGGVSFTPFYGHFYHFLLEAMFFLFHLVYYLFCLLHFFCLFSLHSLLFIRSFTRLFGCLFTALWFQWRFFLARSVCLFVCLCSEKTTRGGCDVGVWVCVSICMQVQLAR